MGGLYDHGNRFTIIRDLADFCFSSACAERCSRSKCSSAPDIYFDSHSIDHHIDFYSHSNHPSDCDVFDYADGNPGEYDQLQLHKHCDAVLYDRSDINAAAEYEYVDPDSDISHDSNTDDAISDYHNVTCLHQQN